MLNRLVRYGPVIRRLDRMERANILEVGSGSLGLCEFYDQKVVGCDIEFKAPISPRLVPVQSCGLHLPFAAESFDVVVCTDVLEHIYPNDRTLLVEELSRVARQHLIIAFPCGDGARRVDEILYRYYRRRGTTLPDWLMGHRSFSYPDVAEVQEILAVKNWHCTIEGNENLVVHLSLMILESLSPFSSGLSCFSHRANGLWLTMLSLLSFGGVYRKIIFATKEFVKSG